MPINTYTHGADRYKFDALTKSEYVGHVLEVKTTRETRNMSDTLDYSDYRTVDCISALVWLGEVGHPHGNEYIEARPLEFWEQFTWIDCSNHFADRSSCIFLPEVDASPHDGANPLMWTNYLAWVSHKTAEEKRKTTERLREMQEREEALRTAQATEAAAQAAAQALLDKYCPPRGTSVTIDNISGQVFWSGVKKYRGRWRSTVGVKDKSGTAHWIDISKFMPTTKK
jgi:hypothetical protein